MRSLSLSMLLATLCGALGAEYAEAQQCRCPIANPTVDTCEQAGTMACSAGKCSVDDVGRDGKPVAKEWDCKLYDNLNECGCTRSYEGKNWRGKYHCTLLPTSKCTFSDAPSCTDHSGCKYSCSTERAEDSDFIEEKNCIQLD
jgi:hypothetical protein